MVTYPLAEGEFITLGQLLKVTGFLPTGGIAKFYLQEEIVLVSGEREQRRGRKLYKGDTVQLPDGKAVQLV